MTLKPDVALSDDEWAIVRDILQTYIKDHSVWVFGSRARHTHHPYSDLDIAVIGDHALTFATMGELRQAFKESALP
jgi:predicted nucleotidyltransferase